MTVEEAMKAAKDNFQKALQHMREEFKKLQVGRASPVLVDGLMVEMYGTHQPLKALANVSIPDPKTLSIQPWDRNALVPIEKAISNSGLGLNPINNGLAIILNMPPMTEERRTEVVRRVKTLAEEARIAVRASRQDAMVHVKKLKETSDITEDDLFSAEKEMQTHVDAANKQIEDSLKAKEQDIMTI